MDISKKLESILTGIDKSKINGSKKTITELLATPEGRKLVSQLGSIDKNKLYEAFMSMDAEEIKRKLQTADLSKLSGLKAEDILKKLR